MKRVCLLACCAVLSGCIHAAPGEVKKESAAAEQKKPEAPAPAAKQERQVLSTALVEKTIIKGKTTKQEIIAKLGPPNGAGGIPRRPSEVTQEKDAAEPALDDRTAEYWNYWTVLPMEALKQGGTYRIFRLTIYFDDKDVALDYRAGESTVNLP